MSSSQRGREIMESENDYESSHIFDISFASINLLGTIRELSLSEPEQDMVKKKKKKMKKLETRRN